MAAAPNVAPVDIAPSGGTYEPTFDGETYMPSPSPTTRFGSRGNPLAPVDIAPSGGTYEPTLDGETYMPSPAPSRLQYSLSGFEQPERGVTYEPTLDEETYMPSTLAENMDISPSGGTYEPTYDGETYLPTISWEPTDSYYYYDGVDYNNNNYNIAVDPLAPAAAPQSLEEMTEEFKEEWKEWRKDMYNQAKAREQEQNQQGTISHKEALFFFIGVFTGMAVTLLTLWVASTRRRRLYNIGGANHAQDDDDDDDDNDDDRMYYTGKRKKKRFSSSSSSNKIKFRDVKVVTTTDEDALDNASHYSDLAPSIDDGKNKWKRFRDVI
mmetsp:Transcript_18210/g.27536  ORF Transcript_18210/g.27536 Transcript_18210/m.27536 type:complete len:324 (+) Transcript_18210:47-1018(+)